MLLALYYLCVLLHTLAVTSLFRWSEKIINYYNKKYLFSNRLVSLSLSLSLSRIIILKILKNQVRCLTLIYE